MSNNRHVHWPDMPLSDDGVYSPQPSSNRVPLASYRNPDRANNDSVARRSECECQNHRTNDPTDGWAGQFNIPTRMESLMEITNMNSLNYESLLHLDRINNRDAMVSHEAAMEEAFRTESAEEVFNAINTSMGFTDFGFSHEIERSRTKKKFTITETTKRRTVRDTCGAPSQSATHVYKKVDTVELQTWFEGEDCYVAAADAGVFCGNTRRRTHRS